MYFNSTYIVYPVGSQLSSPERSGLCKTAMFVLGDFQQLQPVKSALQEISLYVMEHLVLKTWVTSFEGWRWSEAEARGFRKSVRGASECRSEVRS